MSHKIFDNNLVAICKRKLALKLNKPELHENVHINCTKNEVFH